jgi:hypothetical protein
MDVSRRRRIPRHTNAWCTKAESSGKKVGASWQKGAARLYMTALNGSLVCGSSLNREGSRRGYD